jgi:hypothetical protein
MNRPPAAPLRKMFRRLGERKKGFRIWVDHHCVPCVRFLLRNYTLW